MAATIRELRRQQNLEFSPQRRKGREEGRRKTKEEWAAKIPDIRQQSEGFANVPCDSWIADVFAMSYLVFFAFFASLR